MEDLSRSFGETRALNAATLRVRPSEIHSLVGENGSGKSTLIKILSGVLRPNSGTLVWEGEAGQLGAREAHRAWASPRYSRRR